MKALKRTLCSILICMLMMTNMAYAMPAISENSVDDDLRESVLLTDNEKTSSDSTNNSMRGIMLSAGLIEITNQEDGTLHISVDTYAHKIVDSIYQTVFLEVWDEKKENWVQVDHWDFEKSKLHNSGRENQRTEVKANIFCKTDREIYSRDHQYRNGG